MTRIEDLQARLAQALERIGRSVDGYEPPAAPVELAPAPPPETQADPLEVTRLQEALEDEKLTNAQLKERLRVVQDRHSAEDAALREQLAAQKEGMAALDDDLQRLRRSNDALREICEALREANVRGLADPALINTALSEELDAMRTSRAADAAETRAVMDALTPLLEGAARDAASEETA